MAHTLETAMSRLDSLRILQPEISQEIINLTAIDTARGFLNIINEQNLTFPGIFRGEEKEDIRFEWQEEKLDSLITLEISNSGTFWVFSYNTEKDLSESVYATDMRHAAVILTRLLQNKTDLLYQYAGLDETNMQSYNQPIPSAETISSARELLIRLAEKDITSVPSCFITEEGNVLLGWANPHYVTEVEISGDSYECYQLGTETDVNATVSFSTKNADDAVQFFIQKEKLFLAGEKENA